MAGQGGQDQGQSQSKRLHKRKRQNGSVAAMNRGSAPRGGDTLLERSDSRSSRDLYDVSKGIRRAPSQRGRLGPDRNYITALDEQNAKGKHSLVRGILKGGGQKQSQSTLLAIAAAEAADKADAELVRAQVRHFRPPPSKKELEKQRQAFLSSLNVYHDIRAKLEEQASLSAEQRALFSTPNFDVTMPRADFHTAESATKTSKQESVLKEKFSFSAMRICPYCTPGRAKAFCPFHLSKGFNPPRLPTYERLELKMLIEAAEAAEASAAQNALELHDDKGNNDRDSPIEEPEFFMSLDAFKKRVLAGDLIEENL